MMDTLDESQYKAAILPDYEYALEITKIYLKAFERELESTGNRSPIKSIDSRLKTFSSLVEKCERKSIPLTAKDVKERIKDIAGLRIICHFRDDIYTVFDALRKMPNIMILVRKDYVESPKGNGYSSLHIIVSVPIPLTQSEPRLIPVEIQIRDATMDLWASVEHILKYKNPNPNPATVEKLRQVAEHLRTLDAELIELRDYHEENPHEEG